ncbi:MAG: MFS transporter, partial [Aestuariivirgaceae bacterium]
MTERQHRFITPSVIIACGCLIAMIAFGVRSTAGLFVTPVTETYGWGREIYGFAFAVQNLIWGVAQPLVGAFADKLGAVRVVIAGSVVYAAGVIIMAFADTVLLFNLGAGVLIGLGIAATSFAIIMPAFGRMVPPEKRSWAFGMATAASSMGQLVFAPLGQAFIAAFGWQMALVYLSVFLALMIPLVLPFMAAKDAEGNNAADEPAFSLPTVISQAFSHTSYL